ncbi:MAG TPA: ABC transporter permease, partial [Desulfuromonadales bacterium]
MSSKPSFLRDVFWRRLSRNRMALAGGAIVLCMFALALLAPLVTRDPGAIDIARRLQSPNWAFPLGTDDLGRDVLARIFYGARISLLVGFVAVGISTLIGIVLGALAGYYGRWIDALIMRFVDIMLCFPSFFLILAVIAFLEP